MAYLHATLAYLYWIKLFREKYFHSPEERMMKFWWNFEIRTTYSCAFVTNPLQQLDGLFQQMVKLNQPGIMNQQIAYPKNPRDISIQQLDGSPDLGKHLFLLAIFCSATGWAIPHITAIILLFLSHCWLFFMLRFFCSLMMPILYLGITIS